MGNRASETLLLFLAAPSGRYPTDQVRVMKGMFLLSQEGPDALKGVYDFRPYSYGPFATAVYHDLDRLESRNLVRCEMRLGTNQRLYELTDDGRRAAEELEVLAAPDELAAIHDTKRIVSDQSFTELLRYVYERHPEYAVNSRARV